LRLIHFRERARRFGARAPDESVRFAEGQQRQRAFGRESLEGRGIRRRGEAHDAYDRVLGIARFFRFGGGPLGVHRASRIDVRAYQVDVA
jgi:hypothetical protein